MVEKATETRLAKLFDNVDKRKNAAEENSERAKTEAGEFNGRFTEHCNTVIRPAMEDLAQLIEEKGHSVVIKAEGLSITFTVYPHGEEPPDDAGPNAAPFVSYSVGGGRVNVRECTMTASSGGSSGTAGNLALDDVTAREVEDRVVEVLEKAMG